MTSRRPRRRRPTGRGLLLIAVTAAAASCGVPQEGMTTIEPAALPEQLRPTSTTTTTRPAEVDGAGQVAVYWISNEQLVPEVVSFESTPQVERVLSLLERGPSPDRPVAERSVVSQGDVIERVEQDGPVAVVGLDRTFAEIAGSDQVLALGQIVATLTSVPSVDRVRFQQGGDAVDVPLPDGSLVQRPVTRADYVALLGSPGSPGVPTTR